MLTKLITSYASFHQKIESIQCDACLAITEPQGTKFNKNYIWNHSNIDDGVKWLGRFKAKFCRKL